MGVFWDNYWRQRNGYSSNQATPWLSFLFHLIFVSHFEQVLTIFN
jgi:hypothetical protein